MPSMAPIFPRLKPESFAGPQDPCDLCYPTHPHPDFVPATWASLLTLKGAGHTSSTCLLTCESHGLECSSPVLSWLPPLNDPVDLEGLGLWGRGGSLGCWLVIWAMFLKCFLQNHLRAGIWMLSGSLRTLATMSHRKTEHYEDCSLIF